MMDEKDKQRLKEAFKKAISTSPAVDEPIEGMVNERGESMTLRTLFTQIMESDSFYAKAEKAIQKGLTTVERLADQISNTQRISPRR